MNMQSSTVIAPPAPRRLEDMSLSTVMMRDIVLKTLFRKNTNKVTQLARAVCLPVPVCQEIIDMARAQGLMDERKKLENEVAQLRRELAMSGGGQAAPEAKNVNGVPFLAQVLTGVTGKDLPPLVDEHKTRLGTGGCEDFAKAASDSSRR